MFDKEKTILTPCRMGLVHKICREGRNMYIPLDNDTPYVISAVADPDAGKTLWFDFLKNSILGFDAIQKTPPRESIFNDPPRDKELWIKKIPTPGKPSSMIFFIALT